MNEHMASKLDTIQKRNNLNSVYRYGGVGPGGAYHEYDVYRAGDPEVPMLCVQFQKGPRNEEGSVAGVLDADLLEIVRDRLRCFQQGEFSCRENACALTHVEEALMWLNKRVEDRAGRGVLGKNET